MTDIVIANAPPFYQRYLRMGDAQQGDVGFNGKLDDPKEAEFAAENYCSASSLEDCEKFLGYLESSNYSLPQMWKRFFSHALVDKYGIDAIKNFWREIKEAAGENSYSILIKLEEKGLFDKYGVEKIKELLIKIGEASGRNKQETFLALQNIIERNYFERIGIDNLIEIAESQGDKTALAYERQIAKLETKTDKSLPIRFFDYLAPQVFFHLGGTWIWESDLPADFRTTPIHPQDTHAPWKASETRTNWQATDLETSAGTRLGVDFNLRLASIPFLKGELRGLLGLERIAQPLRYGESYETGMIYSRNLYPYAGESYVYTKVNREEEWSLGYGLFWRHLFHSWGKFTHPVGIDLGARYVKEIPFAIEQGWDRWGAEEVYKETKGKSDKIEPFLALVLFPDGPISLGLDLGYEIYRVELEGDRNASFNGLSVGLMLGGGWPGSD